MSLKCSICGKLGTMILHRCSDRRIQEIDREEQEAWQADDFAEAEIDDETRLEDGFFILSLAGDF